MDVFRCNVDLLKIIQLGLTFMDENGKTPHGYTTWQFNFKFNLQYDYYFYLFFFLYKLSVFNHVLNTIKMYAF